MLVRVSLTLKPNTRMWRISLWPRSSRSRIFITTSCSTQLHFMHIPTPCIMSWLLRYLGENTHAGLLLSKNLSWSSPKELICDLPRTKEDTEPFDSIPNASLFLISTTDPWYGDIILYLHTLRYQPVATRDECRRIRYQDKYYLILHDILYLCGVDSILHRCLTVEGASRHKLTWTKTDLASRLSRWAD